MERQLYNATSSTTRALYDARAYAGIGCAAPSQRNLRASWDPRAAQPLCCLWLTLKLVPRSVASAVWAPTGTGEQHSDFAVLSLSRYHDPLHNTSVLLLPSRENEMHATQLDSLRKGCSLCSMCKGGLSPLVAGIA